MKKLSLRIKLIYACGNLGVAIITVMHMLFLVYFFFPPKESGIQYLIPQTSLFMGLTILGLILAFGRIVDAVLDPVIANYSDKLNHKRGKRIPIMRRAALPFALCYVLVFFVPVSTGISTWNVVWLFGFLILSAFFFTCYMIPFYSLMVEMAKTSNDKVDLGTISSAFWFLGFLLVSFVSGMWKPISQMLSISMIWSVRITFSITALIGFIFLMIPALFIDERKYVTTTYQRTKEKVLPSLKKVLQNKNFRYYLVANTGYSIATYIFESGLIYFITVLAVMEASTQGTLTTVIGALTLLCYPLINILAKRKGKKFVLNTSLLLFCLTFIVISTFGVFNINIYILFGLVVLLSPFAQASFGILPQVITSDCAAYDRYKTNEDKSGMYIAANGFFGKLGGSLAMILFTSFLLFGKDIGNDLGIRIATIFGAVLSLVGMFLMKKYNEAEIMTYMNELKTEEQPEERKQ